MITFLVGLALVALLLAGAGVAYYYLIGADSRRRAAIEQERLLGQQRLLYLTQVTMAAMRSAVRHQGRDDG
jgi:hypothetical protein